MLYKRTSEAKFDCEQQSAERIPPTLKRWKRWVSNRPAFAFLFPRYTLGKCSAFESHLRDSKIDLQKEVYFANWRKRWDSNPRAVARKRFSRAPRYDHFGTFPFLFLFSFSQFPKEFLYDFEAFFFHDAGCNGDVGIRDG